MNEDIQTDTMVADPGLFDPSYDDPDLPGNSIYQSILIVYFLFLSFWLKGSYSLLECFYTNENTRQPDEGDLDEEARIFSGQRMYIATS
jgi:hypothetical protein